MHANPREIRLSRRKLAGALGSAMLLASCAQTGTLSGTHTGHLRKESRSRIKQVANDVLSRERYTIEALESGSLGDAIRARFGARRVRVVIAPVGRETSRLDVESEDGAAARALLAEIERVLDAR